MKRYPRMKVDDAIEYFGSLTRLARYLEVSVTTVGQFRYRKLEYLPNQRALEIALEHPDAVEWIDPRDLPGGTTDLVQKNQNPREGK